MILPIEKAHLSVTVQSSKLKVCLGKLSPWPDIKFVDWPLFLALVIKTVSIIRIFLLRYALRTFEKIFSPSKYP